MPDSAPLRDAVAQRMKEAMKGGDKVRVGALRLIMAALKEREIEARGAGKIVSRADELALLTKMVKSRQESATIYAEDGRAELAAQENAEIAVINEFLPKQMDEAAVIAAAKAAIASTGAASVKDMGKVVNALKAAHPGADGLRQGERDREGAARRVRAARFAGRNETFRSSPLKPLKSLKARNRPFRRFLCSQGLRRGLIAPCSRAFAGRPRHPSARAPRAPHRVVRTAPPSCRPRRRS